ncbi:7104_t:CDS:2 [Acaulospora morrowiae]|uniref:7104_t:CDS:1 n=1 Tax=Acaulospora morrowiae TaxID=94023 RepID=A0A9N8VK90_9GLOM|nr:7104_t:CDS:2 [Acaulospora morrowiae]
MSKHLPNELVVDILQNVLRSSSFKYFVKLRIICKKWNKLIPIIINEKISRKYKNGWKIKFSPGFYISRNMNVFTIDPPKFDKGQGVFLFDFKNRTIGSFFAGNSWIDFSIEYRSNKLYNNYILIDTKRDWKLVMPKSTLRGKNEKSFEAMKKGNGFIELKYVKVKVDIVFELLDGINERYLRRLKYSEAKKRKQNCKIEVF